MKHKWHKEIKAWADGAEIEQRHNDHTDNQWDDFDSDWGDGASGWEFRIKPQSKKLQYLYVYKGSIGHEPIFCFARSGDRLVEQNYIGKIKLEE
jgi:hypothetical protein